MKPTFKLKSLVIATLTITSLTACGGGDSKPITTKQPNEPNQPVQKEQPNPQESKISTANSLVKAGSTDAFASYYADTLKGQSNNMEMANATTVDAAPASEADGNNSSGNNNKTDGLSSTNLIETGVDELDYVKQTANNIFVTKLDENGNPSINVFSKPSTAAVSNLPLTNAQNFSGLFLKDASLYALKQVSYGGSQWDNNQTTFKNGKIELDIIDVATPTTPNVNKTISWEGDVENSRRIGDNVYVVSSSRLNETWACAYAQGVAADSKTATDDFIANPCYEPEALTPEEIAERMPVDITGKKVDPAQCYIPKQYNKDSDNLSTNITLITKVDVSGNNNHETTCISASTENFYMSQNALYLASSDYSYENDDYQERSIINKFKLDDKSDSTATANQANPSVTYSGTGVVDGQINWDSAAFAMNEHNDVLRVVTSKWDLDGIQNMLHTLKESTDKLELETIATLPNDQRTKALGKPNERIKGIRFMGDEGYVVTFEQTDPLYKIDLSNPQDPNILGELEMPGYSAYLHKINDKYLMGVGYTVDEKTRENGIQTTIFDTSGDNPIIVAQDTVPAIDSVSNDFWISLLVDQDSRAITTLNNDNQMRVAIPYTITDFSSRNNDTVQTLAIEYTIDLATGTITNSTKRTIYTPENIYMTNNVRALIDNDDIYYSQFDGNLSKFIWGASN